MENKPIQRKKRSLTIDGEYFDDERNPISYEIVLIGFEDIVNEKDLCKRVIDIFYRRILNNIKEENKED